MASEPTPLNAAQQAAVNHLAGPCLVLAGAGSGKTRVIVHKIARLLQSGLEPKRIAAITFTNKAAQEMRERVKALIGPRAARELVVSTFHSLGVRMLRQDGEAVALKPNFSILDSDDALAVLREVGACSNNAQARAWQWRISLWKNQGHSSATVEAADDDERVAARVMALYEQRLAAYQAVDFDDLIGLPLKLLERDAQARDRWQSAFGHVLVDEYQDTNAVQYALLKALVSHPEPRRAGRFTAVGDDDQSIYGWRGATIENLARLPEDWPALKVVALEQNYRSTGAILRAANHLIAGNPKLFPKKLWSDFGDGEPVRVVQSDSEEHEAERAVAFIQAIRGRGHGAGCAWRDFAVLYRANHQAKAFEQKLRAAKIPYKVSGGQSFFDRSEIRDLCAWLRLIVNNDDDPAFLRAIATPKRGIGTTTLTRLAEYASKSRTSLFEALFAPGLAAMLGAKAIASLHDFGRYVNDFEHRARHASGAEDAKSLLLTWLRELGYEQHLHDSEDSDKLAAARWGNVLDFVDWVARRCGGELAADGSADVGERETLWQVAQAIGVIASLAERGDEQDVVTLSTLHAAKGLEWPHVMLAGVNEGLLPFCTEADTLTAARLEEERRLMYVGITRARATLAVSALKRRKKGRETVAARPSRFIAEMRLGEATTKEAARERLGRLRAELAARLAESPN